MKMEKQMFAKQMFDGPGRDNGTQELKHSKFARLLPLHGT